MTGCTGSSASGGSASSSPTSCVLTCRTSRSTAATIIVSNDAANRNLPRIMAMPLTSNVSRVYPGEAVVSVGGQRGKAMADQIMAADKKRLKSKLGALSRADMVAVEDAISLHFGLRR